MTDEHDIDMLAAEYVLGTLPVAERDDVDLRLKHDPQMATAVAEWERRLAPLLETISPQTPPAHIWSEIDKRIAGGPAQVIRLERRLRIWRTTAFAASAIATSLILLVGIREFARPEPEKTFVAVLQKDAQSPAFLVSVDTRNKLLTIRAVAAPEHPGKSYELWLVHEKLGAPRSLGIVGSQPFTIVHPQLAAYSPATIEQATLAVSLEPEGGSPTGAPTGPVLFAGKLVQATE
jgi:anti-sigma-K factor RskA